MGTSKKIVISNRNHGRDFKYFLDYIVDTKDFETDIEILRVLENSFEESILSDELAFSKRRIMRNTPAAVVSMWLKCCTGELLVRWTNLGEVLQKVLKENTVLPNGNYDLLDSCYQFKDLNEGIALFNKLNTEEMFNYWRGITTRCDNSSEGAVGDIYHITFSLFSGKDHHDYFDMPNPNLDIGLELRECRKRNRMQSFKSNNGIDIEDCI